MPKIPRYQQGQLASSVVGTPGVDTSVSDLFKTLASDASQLRNAGMQVAFNAFRQNQIRQAQVEREKRALEREQSRRLEQVQVANERFNIDGELDALSADLREEFASSPHKAVETFRTKGLEGLNNYVNKIDNPNTRAKVLAESLNGLRSRSKSMEDWSRGQQLRNAEAGAVSALDTFSKGLGTKETPEDVLNGIAEFDSNYGATYRAQFPAKYDALFTKAKVKGIENYLSDVSAHNPEKLNAIIESGVFDEHIGKKEMRGIYAKQKQYAKETQKVIDDQVAYDTAVNWTQSIGETSRSLATGSLSMKELDDMKEKAIAEGAPIAVIRSIESQQTALVKQAQKVAKQQVKENNAAFKEGVNKLKSETAVRGAQAMAKFRPKEESVKAKSDQLLQYAASLAQVTALQNTPQAHKVFANELIKVQAQLQGLKNLEARQHSGNLLDLISGQKKKIKSVVPDPKWATKIFIDTETNFLKMLEADGKNQGGKKPSGSALKLMWNAAYKRALQNQTGGR